MAHAGRYIVYGSYNLLLNIHVNAREVVWQLKYPRTLLKRGGGGDRRMSANIYLYTYCRNKLRTHPWSKRSSRRARSQKNQSQNTRHWHARARLYSNSFAIADPRCMFLVHAHLYRRSRSLKHYVYMARPKFIAIYETSTASYRSRGMRNFYINLAS